MRRALLVVAIVAWPACRPASGPATTTLWLDEYRFQPRTMRARSGHSVAITAVNGGKAPHNLVFEDALGGRPAALDVEPGARATLVLTPPTSGSFRFSCTIPGHAASGMTGSLVVE